MIMNKFHVVMNRFETIDSDGVSDEPIFINGTGYSFWGKESATTLRIKGRSDYQLIYVRQGKIMRYDQTGDVCVAREGDVILYKPGEYQKYTYCADEQLVTESYWVHFTGTQVASLLKEYHLYDFVIIHAQGCDESLYKLFVQLYTEIGERRKHHNLSSVAIFLQMIATISRTSFATQDKENRKNVLEPAINHIRRDPSSNLSIHEYASMCHLEQSYFVTLFRKKMGKSPILFRSQMRIEKACLLLMSTDISIKDIAYVCGYNDPLYFSRLFKNHTGKSPKKYRNDFNSGK